MGDKPEARWRRRRREEALARRAAARAAQAIDPRRKVTRLGRGCRSPAPPATPIERASRAVRNPPSGAPRRPRQAECRACRRRDAGQELRRAVYLPEFAHRPVNVVAPTREAGRHQSPTEFASRFGIPVDAGALPAQVTSDRSLAKDFQRKSMARLPSSRAVSACPWPRRPPSTRAPLWRSTPGLPRLRERRPQPPGGRHRRGWRGQQRGQRGRPHRRRAPRRVPVRQQLDHRRGVRRRHRRFCYAVDDNTVARHNAVGTRPAAGRAHRRGHRGRVRRDGPRHRRGGRARHHAPRGSRPLGPPPPPGEAVHHDRRLGHDRWRAHPRHSAERPASGAVCIVRVAGISNIILGDTITVGMQSPSKPPSGQSWAKLRAPPWTRPARARPPPDRLLRVRFCIVGGADGDTGLLVHPRGAILGTYA